MLQSMTGYGRGDVQFDNGACSVELRSVNHRFRELSIQLPRWLRSLESRVSKSVQQRFARGRIEVLITVKYASGSDKVAAADEALARSYLDAVRKLGTVLGLPGEVDLPTLLQLREVIRLEDPDPDMEEQWVYVSAALDAALESLETMRNAEGERLLQDMSTRLDTVSGTLSKVEERLPGLAESYRERLRQKVSSLRNDLSFDPARLEQEVVYFAERSDVSEEVSRLRGHIQEFQKTLKAGKETGRQLDFLLQEMHREVNTLSTKSPDFLVSQLAVQIKSELEKIRQQVQNVE